MKVIDLLSKNTREYLYTELLRKSDELIPGERVVEFSIFNDKGGPDDSWRVEAPDIESNEPVIEGDVVFYCDYWRVTDYNDGREAVSKKYHNPTWKDIINAANEMVKKTCGCQLFLERLVEADSGKGYKKICFEFGS